MHADLLAGAIGQRRGAADVLFAGGGVDAEANDSSTVSSNFAFGNFARISIASFNGYSLVRSATLTALR
jgi:hypothetical protein